MLRTLDAIHYTVRPPMPFCDLGFPPCTVREDSTIHFLWGYMLLDDGHITDVLVTHFSHDFRDFADMMEQHGHELD